MSTRNSVDTGETCRCCNLGCIPIIAIRSMDDLLGFRDDEEENGEAKGSHEFSYLVVGGGS